MLETLNGKAFGVQSKSNDEFASMKPFMRVHILGARGSYSGSKTNPSAFASLTTSVLVEAGEDLIVLDAGSAVSKLKGNLVREWPAERFALMLTHYHMDHVIGFPFMPRPEKGVVKVIGPRLAAGGAKHALNQLLTPPLFPLTLDKIGTFDFVDLPEEPLTFNQGAVTVGALPVNHPGGAMAYRLNFKGRSMCFIPDIELPHDFHQSLDPKLIAFVENTDLLMIDSAYSPEDWPRHIGWGHSHWKQGLHLAKRAGAKQLMPMHFSPSYSDESIEQWEVAAKAVAGEVSVDFARDGLQVTLSCE